MASKRRQFTEEFKSEVVKLVLDGGKSVAEVCQVHELSESGVYRWVKQAKIDKGEGNRCLKNHPLLRDKVSTQIVRLKESQCWTSQGPSPSSRSRW